MSDTTKDSTGPEDDSVGESDRLWLDRLAGRPSAPSDTKVAKDAELLRSYFLKEQAREQAVDEARAAADPGGEERKRQQLLFAARKAGVFSQARPGIVGWIKGGGTAIAWNWQRLGGLAAMLVIGVAIGVSMLRNEGPPYDKPVTMMGDNEVQRITDVKPRSRAESMATQLKSAGMSTRIYQSNDVYFVDVEVLPERFDDFRGALLAAGVEPRPGLVRVQISKP